MANDSFMDLDSLAVLRTNSPSWKLLASDDAAFCCSFFYREFIENNVRNLSEARLVLDMRSFLSEKHSLAGEAIPDDDDLPMRQSCIFAGGPMRITAGFGGFTRTGRPSMI